jgi:hypothetical protein
VLIEIQHTEFAWARGRIGDFAASTCIAARALIFLPKQVVLQSTHVSTQRERKALTMNVIDDEIQWVMGDNVCDVDSEAALGANTQPEFLAIACNVKLSQPPHAALRLGRHCITAARHRLSNDIC